MRLKMHLINAMCSSLRVGWRTSVRNLQTVFGCSFLTFFKLPVTLEKRILVEVHLPSGQIGQLQSTSHEKYSLIDICTELLFVYVLFNSCAIAEN